LFRLKRDFLSNQLRRSLRSSWQSWSFYLKGSWWSPWWI
jgi:hypothetical protein